VNLVHRVVCRSGPWRWVVRRRLVPWALDGLELGDHALEIGPGPGLTTDLIRTKTARLTAVEIDPRLAALLRQRTAGTNVEVVQADATELPFPEGSFSAVLSFTMLHHVPSAVLQDRLLAEAWRVLRPEGVFAGTDSMDSLPLRLTHLGDTWVPVDPAAFSRRLGAAGFGGVVVERGLAEFRFRAFR
jgi:SAM-dependent methyltransferase